MLKGILVILVGRGGGGEGGYRRHDLTKHSSQTRLLLHKN